MDYIGRFERSILGINISILVSLILLGGLNACSTTPHYAPVQNGLYFANSRGLYKVKPGDTLYSIAWAFSQDYRDLARRNYIAPPYAIEVGQYLAITGHAKLPYQPAITNNNSNIAPVPVSSTNNNPSVNPSTNNSPAIVPVAGQQPVASAAQANNQLVNLSANVSTWLWPVHGRILQTFNPATGNKGIDISSKLGSPIVATAAGQVVYSGSGLVGYGNLIIIKHNDNYLSAYADNQTMLVTEGQFVKAGQQIATMGRNDNQQIELHFEIRKSGQPVDPLKYLSNQGN